MDSVDAKRCAELLTIFLEDNCDPEEIWSKVYPDIFEAREILMKWVGDAKEGRSPSEFERLVESSTSDSSESINRSMLARYRGLDEIGEKAYQGQITPAQMFDELLDELEHLFTDDLIDRKRFLAALERKCELTKKGISQELKDIEKGTTKE